MKSDNQKSYFVIHKKVIEGAFNEITEGVKQYLPSICDPAIATAICTDAHKELNIIIPQLPDIGDKSTELGESMFMIAICMSD